MSALEEKFKTLREEGLSDQEIVRRIFQEDIKANVKEMCKITGMSPLDVGRIKGQVSRWAKKSEEEKGPPGGPAEVYKGEPDANAILRRILEGHPDVPAKAKDEIMSWAELRGILDPAYVSYLLSSMKGVSTQTANIVAQKYALALQKAQQEGRVQVPFPIYPPTRIAPPAQFPMMPSFYPAAGQPSFYPPTYPPTYKQAAPRQPGWTPPSYYTPQEVEKLRDDWAKGSRLEKLETSVTKLREDLPKLIQDASPRPEPREYEEVMEFVGKDGKPCLAEKAVSQRIKRIPITTEKLTPEEVRRIIREEKEALTPEKVRSIIREEGEKGKPPSIEEHPTFKSLKEGLEKTEERYNELKETMEAKDKQRIEGTIEELRGELKALRSRPAGQYREDTFRLLDSTLGRLADILEGRKPAETLKEVLLPSGVTSEKPPSERASEADRGGLIGEWRKQGLLVRVVERRR